MRVDTVHPAGYREKPYLGHSTGRAPMTLTVTRAGRDDSQLGRRIFQSTNAMSAPPARARSHTGNQNDGGLMLGPEQQIE